MIPEAVFHAARHLDQAEGPVKGPGHVLTSADYSAIACLVRYIGRLHNDRGDPVERSEWQDMPAQVRAIPEDELPAEVREKIARSLEDGVTYTLNWRKGTTRAEKTRITAIHWRPGLPSALAEAIIEQVQGPMPLDIDGHWYVITPAEAPSDQA